MSKYVQTGIPRKTVGAYLKAVKALNELHELGEEIDLHQWEPIIVGLTGRIIRDDNGTWRYGEGW